MPKSFDQYLSESGQQSKLDELRRTGQYDSAKAQYEGGGTLSGGSDFASTLARAQEIQRNANQPVISSLQSSIPEIQKSYATTRSTLEAKAKPLQDRYNNLLAEIKGNQQTAENRQTLTTNNELGKRGILGSSGVAQQEITNAVNPITQQYTGLYKDTALAGEQAQQTLNEQISGLSSEEVSALRNVTNAIAQAEASGNTNAINLALQQVQSAQQQAAQDRAYASEQQQYNEITKPTALANISNIKSEIAKRNQPETGGLDVNSFLGLFNSPAQTSSSRGLNLGKNVIDLLKTGNIDQALQLAMNP